MTHPAWYAVVALVTYILYGVFLVHKARMASLRAIRRVQRALNEKQLDIAVTLLADIENIFNA